MVTVNNISFTKVECESEVESRSEDYNVIYEQIGNWEISILARLPLVAISFSLVNKSKFFIALLTYYELHSIRWAWYFSLVRFARSHTDCTHIIDFKGNRTERESERRRIEKHTKTKENRNLSRSRGGRKWIPTKQPSNGLCGFKKCTDVECEFSVVDMTVEWEAWNVNDAFGVSFFDFSSLVACRSELNLSTQKGERASVVVAIGFRSLCSNKISILHTASTSPPLTSSLSDRWKRWEIRINLNSLG